MEVKERVKVLRIINRFNIGGPTYNATFLTRFLSDEFETQLIGGLPEINEADSLHVLEEYGVTPILIEEMKRNPSLMNDIKAFFRIRKIIKSYRPHIVHTHASKAGAIGRLAAKSCGVPVIVHTFHGHVFHSYFGKIKTRLVKTIERFLARLSTGIIVISELQKEEIVSQFNIVKSKKVEVIPLGFDLAKFHQNLEIKRANVREKYRIQSDEIAIAIVGRLAPIKNHFLFLNVVEKALAKTSQKLKVFIVGDGDMKAAIAQRVSEINAQYGAVIEMTSWEKDIATFNAGMDIVCLSSNNEGTPVSLIEAQAANIPVISTNVGGVSDVVKEGETGFIVPKENEDAFLEKLLFLIENENIRKKMSQNGWNYVQDKFSYITLVKNTEKYYQRLLTKHRK